MREEHSILLPFFLVELAGKSALSACGLKTIE